MPASSTVSAGLRDRLPIDLDAADARPYIDAFRRSAELLLNQCTFFVAGRPHRLTEIEFYWTDAAHSDPFTHSDPLQREFGRWYFHRRGGTYLGGTYKGLDIAVGGAGRSAGILLRGIEALPSAERVDGSCSVVDRILDLCAPSTGIRTVHALAAEATTIDPSAAAGDDPRQLLALEVGAPGPARPLFASARVGLTLKRGADPARRAYLARPYRFVVDPKRLRKGRLHVVLAAHQAGLDAETIHRQTGVARGPIARYIAAFEAGRGRDPADYCRALKTAELSELFGALSEQRRGQARAHGTSTAGC